jgi:hypothetical protein
MQAAQGKVGQRFIDSVTLITPTLAAALKTAAFDGCFQYLGGGVTAQAIQAITSAGLAFGTVTFADRFDGAATVAELHALGLPNGITTFLDVEGIGPNLSSNALIARINTWATAVQDANYEAGLYVGAGCPLTSIELYALKVTRYWKGLSRIIDRNGQLAEPGCGWCVHQLFPTVDRAGVNVDINFIQQDFRGRLPTWTVA